MARTTLGAAALSLLMSCAAMADGLTAPVAPVDPVLIAPEPEGRQRLGTVRLFNNDWFGDVIGDRSDRWRTGSYQVSAIRGRSWDGVLPSTPFSIMEYRIRGEIIAPDNLASPAPGDRRYATTLWFGAHTHFDYRGLDLTAGVDLVVTGPQTGLGGLHQGIHSVFGGTDINLDDYRIENGFYLHGTAEAGRDLELSFGSVRPFLEVQAGVETLARVGVDLTFGQFADGAMMVRDPVTGQRVAAIAGGDGGGWSLVLGADIAQVESSIFLPSNGPAPEDQRHRLRAGVNYALGASNLFYGVTYLSEEFVGQPEGQYVGSLSLMLRF